MLMLAAWAVASSSEEEVQKTPKGPDPEKVPTMVTHHVQTLVSDSGYYDIQKRMWSAVGNVRLSMRSGDRILCERMYYDENTSVVNCMDNVRITRTTGDKIETNQMFYNTSTRRTYGDAFIHIEGGGRVIEVFGYEYSDNDKRYVVRRVQGIFPIDDSRFRPH